MPKTKSKTKSKPKSKKVNPWLKHVKKVLQQYKRKHKGIVIFKEVLKIASKSYKKK